MLMQLSSLVWRQIVVCEHQQIDRWLPYLLFSATTSRDGNPTNRTTPTKAEAAMAMVTRVDDWLAAFVMVLVVFEGGLIEKTNPA